MKKHADEQRTELHDDSVKHAEETLKRVLDALNEKFGASMR